LGPIYYNKDATTIQILSASKSRKYVPLLTIAIEQNVKDINDFDIIKPEKKDVDTFSANYLDVLKTNKAYKEMIWSLLDKE
jgi:hypothetical protein